MFRHLLESSIRTVDQRSDCLLRHLLEHVRSGNAASPCQTEGLRQLGERLERLLARGYTLRRHFPNARADVQDVWLGRRLVLAHSRWWLGDAHWTSVVSSRLGRYGRLLADWPTLLEMFLRSIRRTGSLYLAVPGTTIAPLVEPLLARGAVPYVEVCLPGQNASDVAAWLAAALSNIDAELAAVDQQLYLSTELSGAPSVLECWPLQDRIAVCCAERVRALLVRPHGAIAHLLEQRLSDPRFCTGTVSVWLPSGSDFAVPRPASSKANCKDQRAWLDRGAVGWYIAGQRTHQAALGCRERRLTDTALWQLSSKYALWCSDAVPPPARTLRYLVHCVRGAPGALPPEAAAAWLAQLWLAGHVPDDSPLATLAHILESGILRGRSALNRTNQPCVSFSGVPLDQLIGRRAFQPHLGRWDWEPYGLMIERQALEALGARPVIYGNAEAYRQLSAEERPFFQPATRRRRSRSRIDWQEECEWRIVGDVRLNDLPRRAVQIFVAYEHQAAALARHSAWPVIWLRDAQTLAPPAGSKHRSRTEVQTGRS